MPLFAAAGLLPAALGGLVAGRLPPAPYRSWCAVGLRMRAAVGASLLAITANSLAAPLTRGGSAHRIDWAALAPFTGTAILGAWDGKRLAARVPGDALRRVSASVLPAVAAFMLIDVIV